MASLNSLRAAMANWLQSPEVRGPGGAVMSWSNPVHPGYPYLEAGGLWLRWATQRGVTSELRRPTAAWLWAAVERDDVGRDGARYSFDTGVVLAGLDAHGGTGNGRTAAHWETLAKRIAAGIAVDPSSEPRWSTRVGPHCLKLAVGALQRPAGAYALLHALGRLDWHTDSDGRIPTCADGSTYVHAHAYAVEGLLALSEPHSSVPKTVTRRFTAAAQEGARWLAAIQPEHGGLPAFHDGDTPRGPSRSDATAQAIRLWVLLDREAFATPIARAVHFLRNLASDTGGLRYDDASDDINTWATLFAEQALAWVDGEPAQVLDLL